MNHSEFRQNLMTIGWTYRTLATRLGIPEARAKLWSAGAETVPNGIAAWLNRAAAFHRANPPPSVEIEHLRTERSVARAPSMIRKNLQSLV